MEAGGARSTRLPLQCFSYPARAGRRPTCPPHPPHDPGSGIQGPKKADFQNPGFQVKYFYYQNYYISCESSNVTAWCKNSTRVRSYSPHLSKSFPGSLPPAPRCVRRCWRLCAGPPRPPPATRQGRARLPHAAHSMKGEAAHPGRS